MSRNKSRTPKLATRRRQFTVLPRWKRWGLVISLVAVGIGMFLWWRDDPRHLLREALAIRDTDPSRADELFERSVVAAGGNFPEAQLERTLLYADRRQWPEALGCFSQIANPKACDPVQLLRLARQSLEDGSGYLAELALAAARRPSPVEADVLRLLIKLNERKSLDEDVLRDCARLAECDPVDPLPWLIQGKIYARNRDAIAALDAFQNARDRRLSGSDLNDARGEMAELYLHEGNLPAAREQLEQLADVRPKTVSDRLKWSYLLRQEGSFKDAIQEADIVLQKLPNEPRALELRGTIRLDCGETEAAIEDLQRVLALQPSSVEAHSKLGQAYQKLQQSDQAAFHLKKSRQLIECRTELVGVLKELNQNSQNQKLRQRAAELYEALGQSQNAARLRQP